MANKPYITDVVQSDLVVSTFMLLENIGAGEQTATKVITPPLDWFEMSKEKTQPKIDVVNAIRKQLREC